ncbi:hypothetical protein PM082_024868 [Marasmius tenuissimus]|nr:hypothetical protein PM082_024868 [Marasmius tenuissimus]
MAAYDKQQDEIQHITKYVLHPGLACIMLLVDFVKVHRVSRDLRQLQAKSRQKIMDKMEAVGLVKPIEYKKPLRNAYQQHLHYLSSPPQAKRTSSPKDWSQYRHGLASRHRRAQSRSTGPF